MIPTPQVILRECRKCGWRGPLTGFVRAPTCRFDRSFRCKVCHRQITRAIVEEHKSDPEWVLAQREYKRVQMRDWRAVPENREKHNASSRVSVHAARRDPARRPAILARDKRYYEQNMSDPEWLEKERARGRKKAREAMVPGQEPYETESSCRYCGGGDSLAAEHVIPRSFWRKGWVSSEVVGSVENLVTACKSCNSSKWKRLPDVPELLDIIERLLGYDPKTRFEDKHFWSPA